MFKKLREYLKEVKEQEEKECERYENERLIKEEISNIRVNIDKGIEEGMLVSEFLKTMENIKYNYYIIDEWYCDRISFISAINNIASEFPNVLNEKVKILFDYELREQLLSAAKTNAVVRIIGPKNKE